MVTVGHSRWPIAALLLTLASCTQPQLPAQASRPAPVLAPTVGVLAMLPRGVPVVEVAAAPVAAPERPTAAAPPRVRPQPAPAVQPPPQVAARPVTPPAPPPVMPVVQPPAPEPVRPTPPAPAPTVVLPAPLIAVEVPPLVGADERTVGRLFGEPATVAEVPPAVEWLYGGGDCRLRLVFFREVASGNYRVLSYDVAGHNNGTDGERQCISRHIARPR